MYGFPYHDNHNHNNPNNRDHHNHHSHPHFDLQGLRLCGTSRLLPTDEGLTVGREQRTYLWRIKSINKFQKSYFLSSLWHTGKSFGSSIFAFGAFCTYEFVFVFCISVFQVAVTRNIWSRWQSHFGLCGLAICGTASTCDAVPQIEDNKTNGKQSDAQDGSSSNGNI